MRQTTHGCVVPGWLRLGFVVSDCQEEGVDDWLRVSVILLLLLLLLQPSQHRKTAERHQDLVSSCGVILDLS